MSITATTDENHIGLIQRLPCGRIRQIGTTEQQQQLLQLFLASIAKDDGLYALPESFDLVLKAETNEELK